jgi:hypothetical protein
MTVHNRGTLSEPQWPTQRGVDRYQALLGIDVTRILAGGGVWVDVGPGTEALPMVPFMDRPDVTLKCVGIHSRTLPRGIDFTLGAVPDDTAFLERQAGTATLVTDVYSSVTYSDDPLLALAYCVLLLRAGGTCGVFTELKRMGDLTTWDRVIQLFRSELHVAMSCHALSIVEDASQSHATALRIQATRGQVDAVSFNDAAALLHARIGHPVASGTIWEAPDQSIRIRQIDYR